MERIRKFFMAAWLLPLCALLLPASIAFAMIELGISQVVSSAAGKCALKGQLLEQDNGNYVYYFNCSYIPDAGYSMDWDRCSLEVRYRDGSGKEGSAYGSLDSRDAEKSGNGEYCVGSVTTPQRGAYEMVWHCVAYKVNVSGTRLETSFKVILSLEDAIPSPTPTVTPEPTATATPRPTSTPRPTAMPTPRPTNTPVPTATPRPTNTPVPSPTPTLPPSPTPTPPPELYLNAYVENKVNAAAEYYTSGCIPVSTEVALCWFYRGKGSPQYMEVATDSYISGHGSMSRPMEEGCLYRYRLDYTYESEGVTYTKTVWSDWLEREDEHDGGIRNFPDLMRVIWFEVFELEIPIEGYRVKLRSLVLWALIVAAVIFFVRKVL